jgi:hypothetical protein
VQLVYELGVHQLVVEVGVAVGAVGAVVPAEANPALLQLLRGKDPVEAVERALVERRVVLERTGETAHEGRLGAPVRPVEQEQLVDRALASEVGDRAVHARLHLLLPHQPIAPAVPRRVEQAPARHHPARRLQLDGAEVIEHVFQVLRGGARVEAGPLEKCLEELVERHHATVARVGVAHFLSDL